MTATARFPDGDKYELDDSAARHMQVGDTIAVPDHKIVGADRIGIVTRRVWNGTDLIVHATNPGHPIPRPAPEERDSTTG